MKSEKEIKKAIEDSKKYFSKHFPCISFKAPVMSFKEVAKSIKGLAIANEICTLEWVLGNGKLNCYGDKK